MHQHEDDLAGGALFYACAMGWPLTPLTFLVTVDSDLAFGCSCEQQCDQPCAHPIDEMSPGPIRNADAVIKWWSQAPFNIGILTGQDIDAVDVPADTGSLMLRQLRELDVPLGPVLSTSDRVQFFVRPSPRHVAHRALETLRDDLADPDLRYLGGDRLLVAPPSVLPSGGVWWVIEPDAARPHLPDALDLLEVLELAPAMAGGSVGGDS